MQKNSKPLHPREVVLAALNEIGWNNKQIRDNVVLSNIIYGQHRMYKEDCETLERITGRSSDYWNNVQVAYLRWKLDQAMENIALGYDRDESVWAAFCCSCGCHVISVSSFNDADEDVYIGIFENGGYYCSFKDKLKAIWKLLTRGVYLVHEVILSNEDARSMSDLLHKAAETAKQKSDEKINKIKEEK